jgi:hypothetical protein
MTSCDDQNGLLVTMDAHLVAVLVRLDTPWPSLRNGPASWTPYRRIGADRMVELKDQLSEQLRREGFAEAVLQAHAVRVSINVYRMRVRRRPA